MTEMKHVVVQSVPPNLLKKFDEAIEGKYATRSEALRDLMRKYVAEQSHLKVNCE